jgi:hypothetical protein
MENDDRKSADDIADTKIAIVVRDDLQTWQRLNVTAFLMSGITAENPGIIGEPYVNASGNTFLALSVQPVIVLVATLDTMRTIHARALDRGVRHAAYVEEMFTTYNDRDNRAAFAASRPTDANFVGLAFRAERKLVDKMTKGASKHP